jgi:hypothetical protein
MTISDRSAQPAVPATRPGRDGGVLGPVRRHPLLSFFVLATVMSWLAWVPYILSRNGLGIWSYRFPDVLGTSQLLGVLPGAYLGPIAAALFVTAVADGRAGLRHWVGRMWRWRVRWHWYAVTLLGVPAAMLVTGYVFSGGQVSTPSAQALVAYLPGLLCRWSPPVSPRNRAGATSRCPACSAASGRWPGRWCWARSGPAGTCRCS